MLRADHVIDLGPAAGRFGGTVVAQGSPHQVCANPASVTGPFIRKNRHLEQKWPARALPEQNAKNGWIRLQGAKANNLQNLDVNIPVARFTVITGISGSGKSSLMRGSLMPAVQQHLSKNKSDKQPKAYKTISGLEAIEAAYEVDQSPIGKTSRSTPATYLKLFDEIRTLFAATPQSRARGYQSGRFSFNTEGGRCETCGGNGLIKHEMMFLPNSYTVCEDCQGSRYNMATLEIEYNGKNIGQVCQMSVDEACEFFSSVSKIRRVLELLKETGLGYLQLGQASPTLSGGEAQRLKLVTELSRGEARAENTRLRKNQTPKSNLYLIEEPSIGLHPADVQNLLTLLQRLVQDGHTVVVIEHDLDLIAAADYVIDIGPEAGAAGGKIVTCGTPKQVAKHKSSHTARFLRG
jgi:excinuclease ABC subunit A